ncbi:MAG: tRNA lysidine(34) synthetase TilS [Candidatus Eisenbacteria bacterium]|nr:tRNA lysidine(34) synthetase TilS [Candidatus Eisenbacteria bacterium]
MLAKKVGEFIETKGLIVSRDSVLVAVSGGADSVALLQVLFDLHRDMGFTLEAAHLNHGIRGNAADEDADFVEKMCLGLGIACHVGRADAPSFAKSAKLSTEEAARELRHGFLKDRAAAHGHNKIALGHTMNDQAETVLMHIIRGAGILGVSGMKPISKVGTKTISETCTSAMPGVSDGESRPDSGLFFIRPFLATSRAEVNEFIASRQIAYREDASNVDAAFMRNRVRHELVEILREKYNPRIVEVLSSHASLVAEAEDYLSKVASEAYRNCVREETREHIQLELTSLLSYHTFVQSYILREAYRRLCGSLRDLSFTHVASLIGLISSGQSGDSVDIALGKSAWLDGRRLWIGRTSTLRSERAVAPKFAVRLEPGNAVSLPLIGLEIDSRVLGKDARSEKLSADGPTTGKPGAKEPGGGDLLKSGPDRVIFDLEKLTPPLVLRSLEPGDRMTPFGMDGTRKIQDLLVDLKVPRSRRKRLAAFCDQSQVLWVVGIRRSNAASVNETTELILSVEVKCI